MESVIIVEQEQSESEEKKVDVTLPMTYRKHHSNMMRMIIDSRRREYLGEWKKRLWDCKKVI